MIMSERHKKYILLFVCMYFYSWGGGVYLLSLHNNSIFIYCVSVINYIAKQDWHSKYITIRLLIHYAYRWYLGKYSRKPIWTDPEGLYYRGGG